MTHLDREVIEDGGVAGDQRLSLGQEPVLEGRHGRRRRAEDDRDYRRGFFLGPCQAGGREDRDDKRRV